MRPLQQNDVFHAVAHPARRAMLVSLKGGDKPVGELAAPFGMTLAAVSQHLKVLREAELVSERREGRQRIYKLEPMPLQEIATWADEFQEMFNSRLDALSDYLDRKHGRKAK